MKFKEIKQIIRKEWLTIFEVFPYNVVLRKEHWQLESYDEPTEWDEHDVDMITGKADCELYIYLEHKR